MVQTARLTQNPFNKEKRETTEKRKAKKDKTRWYLETDNTDKIKQNKINK